MKAVLLAIGVILLWHIKLGAQAATPCDSLVKPYENIDTLPEFPGGYEAWQKWFNKNFHYPLICSDSTYTDVTVHLKVVFSCAGKVQSAAVTKGMTGFNDEAIAVMQKSPAWIPGKLNGKAVPVVMTIPMRFKIK